MFDVKVTCGANGSAGGKGTGKLRPGSGEGIACGAVGVSPVICPTKANVGASACG